MPRTTTTKNETETTSVKRAVRRTVTKRVITSDTAGVRARRSADSSSNANSTSSNTIRRKAPTNLVEDVGEARDTTKKSSGFRRFYVAGGVLVASLIGAVMIGRSDTGPINTAAIIAERNAQIIAGTENQAGNNGEVATEQIIPVQSPDNQLPNRGLIPSTEADLAAVPRQNQAQTAPDLTESPVEEIATSSEGQADAIPPPAAETTEVVPAEPAQP